MQIKTCQDSKCADLACIETAMLALGRAAPSGQADDPPAQPVPDVDAAEVPEARWRSKEYVKEETERTHPYDDVYDNIPD